MASPFGTLLKKDFLAWLSVRGVLLLLAAAAFPAILTGAWVVTHQADADVVDLSWEPDPVRDGDNVTFTALIKNSGRLPVGSFNVTVATGPIQGNRILGSTETTEAIEGLRPGEERPVTLEWTARAGLFGVFVLADPDNELSELEEFNNVQTAVFLVEHAVGDPANAPAAPGNLTGTAGSPSGGLVVGTPTWSPDDLRTNTEPTFNVTVTNDGPDDLVGVSLTLEAGRIFGGQFFPEESQTDTVDIAAGQSVTVTLEPGALQRGTYWLRGYANATDANHDPDASNNHQAVSFAVNPQPPGEVEEPEIPERLTIKQFYIQVLLLHFWIVVPFIALFFAAGVVSDEQNSGNLAYLLTRPIPRPLIAASKFLTGFAWAALAVVIANVAAYLILFGFGSQGDIGFLTTPVMASLVALFAYTSLFTLMGTVFNRPYVIGIVYILLWESLGLFDQLLQISNVDIQIEVAEWVERATIIFNLGRALGEWPLDEGFVFLPGTAEAVGALRTILLVGVGLLILAAIVMTRREFDV